MYDVKEAGSSIPKELLGVVFRMSITVIRVKELMAILVAHGFLGIGIRKVSIKKQL